MNPIDTHECEYCGETFSEHEINRDDDYFWICENCDPNLAAAVQYEQLDERI